MILHLIVVILSIGGETTVNLPPNNGIGGRNQHAALAALIQLSMNKDIWRGNRFVLG